MRTFTTVLCVAGSLAVAPLHAAPSLAGLERLFADFNDAQGAIGYIDAAPAAGMAYQGRSRAQWQAIYTDTRSQLLQGLQELPKPRNAADGRAVEVMRSALADTSPEPESLAPTGHCAEAQRTRQPLRTLQQSLYACFSELGNQLAFEGGRVTRVAAFELLTRLPESERRRALFLAFRPLWRAINEDGSAGSPYRRMIVRTAAQERGGGGAVEAAAHTLGIARADVERWLELALQRWEQVSPAESVEPWDYRFAAGAAERELAEAVPREALTVLNQRFYADLGLDLTAAGVWYDLDARPGKAPLAYTDYIRRGRLQGSEWQPTLVRVSASYEHGGLGPLNELVHENGHAAHMLALRTRPAFMDLGDPLFYEAFADVPSWSVYESSWQQKYLGRHARQDTSLRARDAGVMLDVAWALFDCRMLRRPHADPNQVWTQITSRYLHIRPHPELPWWAMRVQLVDHPGYMVNYGLGAVLTADIRQHVAEQIGPFDAGNPRWFGWLSTHLLGTGEEQPTALLLRRFLGRAVSPQALLAELQRLAPGRADTAPPTGR
ncbi:MAG: hypothetical protein JOZ67_01205 [Gammaproteobacteria bacterium]|nr:hypothetical protein [Gammaproteobacteria bacterium]